MSDSYRASADVGSRNNSECHTLTQRIVQERHVWRNVEPNISTVTAAGLPSVECGENSTVDSYHHAHNHGGSFRFSNNHGKHFCYPQFLAILTDDFKIMPSERSE